MMLRKHGVKIFSIGTTGGQDIVVRTETGKNEGVSLSDIRTIHENWLPNYMTG